MEDSEKKCEFIWRIENFNSHLPDIGNTIFDSKCLASPNFTFYVCGYTKWYLELYPKTGRNSAFIKCLPICSDYAKDYTISCELSILGKDNSVHATKKTKCRFSAVFHCDFSNALEVQRSNLPLQSDLILRCILSFKDSDVENEYTSSDSEDLSRDLYNLYSSKVLSDLTLCSGNDKLPVHRTVLCIRAPVLAEKIGIQDGENFLPVVKVNDISFSALKVLIEYMYTGKIDRKVDGILSELYKAAEEYNLDHLKYELLPIVTHSTASTKIRLSKELLTWQISNFSSLKTPVGRLIDLKLSRFMVTLTPTPSDAFQLSFKAASFPESQQFYLSCKMRVIDKDGNFSLASYHTHLFESDKKTKENGIVSKESWDFPTLLKKKDLISNAGKYLPNGALNLDFDLEITEGDKINEIVEQKKFLKALSGSISHLNYLSSDLLDIFKARNRPFVGGDYYDGDCYNDAILQVDEKEVGCHKAVLSARSPVFAKLLQQDTKKKERKIIITDVDYETVLLMVQYIYSGQLNNVSAMETAKLYLAAERYQIVSLIKRCVSILEISLTVHNVCDVLVLAYDNRSETLLHSVYQYIKCNKAEVRNSSDWKQLMENNPALTSTVLSKISEGRSRPREFYRGILRRSGFRVNPSGSKK